MRPLKQVLSIQQSDCGMTFIGMVKYEKHDCEKSNGKKVFPENEIYVNIKRKTQLKFFASRQNGTEKNSFQ